MQISEKEIAKHTSLKVGLVAMPWGMHYLANLALATLGSLVRKEQPWQKVSLHFAYLELFSRIPNLYNILANNPLSELIYLALLHPERLDATRQQFVQLPGPPGVPENWSELKLSYIFDQTHEAAKAHLEELSEELRGYDVIGLSTSFYALFSSLALAALLRKLNPKQHLFLGGHGVSFKVGASVLDHYSFIDTVIQGEGEIPLLQLLNELSLCKKGLRHERRVLSAAGLTAEELNELPTPELDEYAAMADKKGIQWSLQVEGSRGCWYDRVRQTGDLKKICYFCGLDTGTWRRKQPARTVQQISEMAMKYRKLCVTFVDYVLFPKGALELAEAIEETGLELAFHHELRAETSVYQLLRLWEAGCVSIQCGIEGLSNSYLERLGKGTTVIQNLQIMRAAFELDISCDSNLILSFPGATESEVKETEQNIRRYAWFYEPLSIGVFGVDPGSTVARIPESFGITLIPPAYVLNALPESFCKLELPLIDYEPKEGPSWKPVAKAVQDWREFIYDLRSRTRPAKPLVYRDGGDFLEIVDERRNRTNHILNGVARELYLYTMQIRTRGAINLRFSTAEVSSMLEEFLRRDLMYRDGERYLSLAVSTKPHIAAKRIRQQNQVDQSIKH